VLAEIRMRAVSPGMTEGAVACWRKAPGDPIQVGDVIVDVETEKATIELLAERAGVLDRVVIPAGPAGVPVGAVLGVIRTADEPHADAGASTDGASHQPAQPATPRPAPRIKASPRARRLAREHRVDLATLRGSGPNGRIVRVDLERVLAASQSKSSLAPAAPTPDPAPLHTENDFTDTPTSQMRKTIAHRLGESKREAPHFYLKIECEVDRLLALRTEINQAAPHSTVSLNDCLIRAAALALRSVPELNVSWRGEAIRRFHHVTVCCAVATDKGLTTVAVARADTKPVTTIAAEMKALGSAARAGAADLAPAGGITLSNLGMYGVRECVAIINPPQASILGIGAAEQCAVVRDGAVAIATRMACTLSADHRCVDGVTGARFLAELKRLIENPLALLL
jgi:pyruvate dehydrogenase E2 component (dihydrolipoamide acetyltransferase)